MAGHKKHIVEGKGFADGGALFHAGVYQGARDSASPSAYCGKLTKSSAI
jgi:hypothetical protein